MATMKILTQNFGSIVGRIVMAIALSSVIASLSVGPAFGAERHDERGRRKVERHDDRGRRVRRPHRPVVVYQPPPPPVVYAPPPVVYTPPPPSPGISLIFPIHIR